VVHRTDCIPLSPYSFSSQIQTFAGHLNYSADWLNRMTGNRLKDGGMIFVKDKSRHGPSCISSNKLNAGMKTEKEMDTVESDEAEHR
jgi:hypothetical protein